MLGLGRRPPTYVPFKSTGTGGSSSSVPVLRPERTAERPRSCTEALQSKGLLSGTTAGCSVRTRKALFDPPAGGTERMETKELGVPRRLMWMLVQSLEASNRWPRKASESTGKDSLV